jgi:glycosyltransferase involved in cell wall biosynthesis
MTTPAVSVVMAVRDGAPYLGEAIASVLAQTLRELELIVVDDASRDDTRAILAACHDRRVVVLENPRHLGLAASLNRGFARARADLVARHDADDRSHPGRLARQVRAMNDRPSLALLAARGHLLDERGRRAGRLDRPLDPYGIRWYQMFDNAFVHSTVMARRRVVVDELGGYDEAFAWSQDWELWGRLLRAHEGANLPDRLVDFRVHANSVTTAPRDATRHREYVCRIIAANVASTLGTTLASDEVDLLAGFLLGLDRADLGRYLALVDTLVTRFHARHPGAAAAGEPSRTLGVQLDALAARVRPPRRASVLAVYLTALRRRPQLVQQLPLARVLVRVVAGHAGIEVLRGLGLGRPVPGRARTR